MAMKEPFRNEPVRQYRDESEREAIRKAQALVAARFPEEIPLVIGGERIATARTKDSLDPSDTRRVVARAAQATAADVDRAMEVAWNAFRSWSRVAPEARARLLHRAAAIMRRRRLELVALEQFEAGKTVVEADADVAEAIDFLEYYARDMYRLAAGGAVTRIPDEDNELRYIPLGVGAIIPPWNFPLAIVTGMTSAAIVTGNAVLLKPASTTPAIAYRLVEIFEEAGLPPGVLNFVPGSGSEIGDHMVDHPKTRFISFTGSRDVGVRIYERAAKVQPGQIWLKRVVAEMGGKDAIVVDEGADYDAAANGIVQAAFGFQGQKCSAASRVIGVGAAYDAVLERVVERTRRLVLGPATDLAVDVGPVIDEAAYRKILDYIEVGRREGRLVAGGAKGPEGGYFIQPTIFADVAPTARIAQEEIFGPVLAFIRAKDFDEAEAIFNGTQYGLTGSLYSRSTEHLERARETFHVGNLYLNRKCTAALVGVHPFGGFNMSGTDSKTGGPDYLLLFLQAKAISERM